MSTITESAYRPSASVIIAVKSEKAEDSYDYRLLLFKRTQHTAFAPDHCVFPGGVFESSADESLAWLQHFREYGITETQLDHLSLVGDRRPHPLLTTGKNFSRDISLRITAIRETFEEVGVLLCRGINSGVDLEGGGHIREDFDRNYWQRKVHDHPEQFLRLCQHLQVVPDLWSLQEWSVWRSPTTSKKKYDTVFYFVALPQQPNLLLERSEVEFELWHSPVEFLHFFSQRIIWLPPIQFYELSRLTHAHNWAQLLQFTRNRSVQGSTLLMPVYYRCNEALIGILPGDDFYPADPNACTETIIVDSSIQDFQKRATRLHRLIVKDMYEIRVELNISPIDGHLSPIKESPNDSKL